MKKHWHKIAAITLLACACVVIVYLIGSREPTFRGKAESHWITNIVYFGPEEQVNQWREFGSDGVRFLAQALDRSGGLTRTYRRFHRSYAHKLPRFLGQLLPQSVNDTSRRMSVLSLLVQLSNRNTNFAKLAEPAVARAMRDDNGSVRQLAAGFYEGTLGHMGGEVAKARLPDFVRLMQDADHGGVTTPPSRCLTTKVRQAQRRRHW